MRIVGPTELRQPDKDLPFMKKTEPPDQHTEFGRQLAKASESALSNRDSIGTAVIIVGVVGFVNYFRSISIGVTGIVGIVQIDDIADIAGGANGSHAESHQMICQRYQYSTLICFTKI